MTMKCNNCNAELPEGAKFCHLCGTKVSITLFCSQCGAPLPPNAAFCCECGTKVADTPADRECQAPPTPQTPPTPNAASASQPELELFHKNGSIWNANSKLGRMGANFGTIIITNRRLLLFKVSEGRQILAGGFSAFMEGNVPVFEVALQDIVDVETKKVLVGYNYFVKSASGERYALAAEESFINILNQARANL